MRNNKLFLIISIILFGSNLIAQSITADKKITVCEGYLTIEEALSKIEQTEKVNFSYNPQNFNIKKEIYLCKRNTKLIDVLKYIFEQDLELIIESQHIIIKPAKKVAVAVKTERIVKISGLVENGINGLPIDSADIEIGGYKFHSNESGYFSFKLSTQEDSLVVYVEKEEFIGYKTSIRTSDISLRVFLYQTEEMDFTYMPSTAKEKNSNIENHWLTNIVVADDQTYISRSRKVLIEKDIQFSVLPNLGTYYDESGLYRFKQSYNVLAGYVGEVYGHEIGLGVNIIRYDLTGFQFAGVANIVGGEVSGMQLSTGANICVGNYKGAQIASTANTTWGNFKGIQVSSGVNLVKSKFRGFQIAPVNIVADTLLGFQIGGVNIASQPANGAQIGGALNYSKSNNFLQYSLLVNVNKDNNSPQIGLINVSQTQSNLQVGFLNFADTVSGMSVGFLSFVRNGYTHIEYSLSGNMFSSLKFKTGTNNFYNIISAGVRTDKELDLLIGYGVGSFFKVWKMFGINYDLSASQVFENNTLTQNLNLLAQFDLNLNFRIARRFTVFGGFQLNGLLTNNLSNDATTFYSSIPANKVWYEKQFASQRTYIWPSFTIGVRI